MSESDNNTFTVILVFFVLCLFGSILIGTLNDFDKRLKVIERKNAIIPDSCSWCFDFRNIQK